MGKHIKKIVLTLVILQILCTCAWRFWPHSFADILSADTSTISRFSCTVVISGIDADGVAFIDSYELQASAEDGEKFSSVIGILDQAKYRQSFQNLLPWAQTAVSSDGSSESANISLVWESAEKEPCFLTLLEEGKMVVGTEEGNGFLIYYAADCTMLDRLVNYVQEYGVKTCQKCSLFLSFAENLSRGAEASPGTSEYFCRRPWPLLLLPPA